MITADPKLPQPSPNEEFGWAYWRRFNQQFYRIWRELYDTLREFEQVMNSPILLVPNVSQDVGSAEVTGLSAAQAYAAFVAQYLPNTATTTSSTLQTALNYTGVGVLQRVVAVAQVAAATSTAAGVNVKITIDGVVVYTNTTAVTAVNQMRAIVGSLLNLDSANAFIGGADDVIGWPFKRSCKIEYASGTNGQGVNIGWRVSKKR